MIEKNSFVFYESFYEQLSVIDDTTIKASFYEAIIKYGLFEQEPNFTGLELALWLGIKKDIDYAKDRREVQKENGKKGGLSKSNKQKQNLATSSETLATSSETLATSSEVYLDVDVDVDVNVDGEGDVNSQNSPPTHTKNTPKLQDIQDYCTKYGIFINTSKFFNHYEALGWEKNGKKIKNWQALVNSWYADDKINNPGIQNEIKKQQLQAKNLDLEKQYNIKKAQFLKSNDGLCKCGGSLSDYTMTNGIPEYYCKKCNTTYILRGDTWIET